MRLGKTMMAVLMSSIALPAIAQDPPRAPGILDNETQVPLSERQIDPLNRVIDLLERSARAGPRFESSIESINIDVVVGERRVSTIQIRNKGDEQGFIERVALLGAVPGLTLETDCVGSEVELFEGDFCGITLSFKGSDPSVFQTVIVVEAIERDTRRIEIPVIVKVSNPPPPPAPEPEPQPAPADEPVIEPEPEIIPKGPTPSDIMRGYFKRSAVGQSGQKFAPSRGFARVRPEPTPPAQDPPAVFGAEKPSIISRTTDPRYDENIPWTKASLPVDRKNILTSDRVIKAVLETPVTSVMCGQVVAMIESDVYSATSSQPLIRAGSRVMGSCGGFVAERVGVSWNRIITTDGRSITLSDGRSETADAMGYGGAVGREFIPFFDQYVLPVFSSVVDAAAALTLIKFGEKEQLQTNDETNRTVESRSTRNEGLRIVTDGVRENARQIIEEIRDIRRKVIIPAGSRIDINLREDVYFPDSEDEVQIADMVYRVEPQPRSSIPRESNPPAFLEPFSPDAVPGPIVVVDGRRFLVRGGASSVQPPAPTGQVSEEEAQRIRDRQIREQISGSSMPATVPPSPASSSPPPANPSGRSSGSAPLAP